MLSLDVIMCWLLNVQCVDGYHGKLLTFSDISELLLVRVLQTGSGFGGVLDFND